LIALFLCLSKITSVLATLNAKFYLHLANNELILNLCKLVFLMVFKLQIYYDFEHKKVVSSAT